MTYMRFGMQFALVGVLGVLAACSSGAGTANTGTAGAMPVVNTNAAPLQTPGTAVAQVTRRPVTSGPAAPVCGPVANGFARCHSLRRSDIGFAQGDTTPNRHLPHATPSPSPTSTPGPGSCPNASISGYQPCDLQSAYKLPSMTAGAGQTVAIVDAYDDPNAESDLNVYRSTFGLAACTTANGCFRKVSQTGGTTYPRASGSWAQEISLDLDMVSAICPNCHVLLVEANSASVVDLAAAVSEAATLKANAVSNSYGASESSSLVSTYGSRYTQAAQGRAVTASSGDSGYSAGPQFPADLVAVTAAGGTHLVTDGSARGWNESVWSDAGSGCSTVVAQPSWQSALSLPAGCSGRIIADAAAVADPNTGVAVYDSYQASGWLVFGGTSVASPIVASVYALAGNTSGLSDSSYPYGHDSSSTLNDVTSGSNGTCSPSYLCTGEVGYDGATGLGTPDGASGF